MQFAEIPDDPEDAEHSPEERAAVERLQVRVEATDAAAARALQLLYRLRQGAA